VSGFDLNARIITDGSSRPVELQARSKSGVILLLWEEGIYGFVGNRHEVGFRICPGKLLKNPFETTNALYTVARCEFFS